MFILSGGALLWLEKESKIEGYLKDKTVRAVMHYNSLYHEHKNLADIIFKTKIDIKEITSLLKKVKSSSDLETKALIRGELHKKLGGNLLDIGKLQSSTTSLSPPK